LSETDLQQLAGRVGRIHGQQGKVLFLEGDRGDEAYLVVSGTVDLVLESLEGAQLALQQVGPGGYFGEMALVDDEPRSATAIAAGEVELLTISRKDLLAHLQNHPETMLGLLRALSMRVRAADAKIRILGFLDVGGRLATTLLDLDQPAGRRATITIRHEQLAAMVGSTRQTVSEILGQWRSAGMVVTGRGRLVVTNRAALEELAEA
jgi:CRP/FNR family transcriptional regulator, cyclic AMP receptor protein